MRLCSKFYGKSEIMRIKRLIQKKTKKFIIKKLSNNFSTLFQAYNLSKTNFCNINNVKIKFFKNTSLAKKGEALYLKIDGQILPKIIKTGKFDDFLFNFLNKNLKENSLFIDVGANHGLVSKQVSNLKKIKKIITFEPVKDIYELSILNLKDKKYVEQFNYGWSKNNNKYPLYENPANSGDYSLIPNKQRNIKHIFNFKNANNVLNRIIKKNKKLSLILKTDCQGYDIELFNSIEDKYLKLLSIYFLECKEIKNKQKTLFEKKIKFFKKIFVSCPLIHSDVKQIKLPDLEKYFNYKVEFDLILMQ